jgi:23S rRNA pseudouridine1911/1915/1917 synthase
VHPGAGNAKGTMLNALLNHAPQLAEVPRAGIVHRLDKDTSGLLVIAKTLSAHTSLVAQLQARTVKREYEAITMGVLLSGGTLKTQIGRHPTQRTKMAVLTEGLGKEAITHVRVLERYRHHTRISANLETGRTHQIRVHMAHSKFPLVGDSSYGGRLVIPKGVSDELANALRDFKRQALHARRLQLTHPETGKLVKWQVKPPADYLHLLQLLREDAKLNLPEEDLYDDLEWDEDEL